MINASQQDIFWFLNQEKTQQVKSAGKPHGSIGDFVRQLTVDSAHYFGDPANASFDLRPGRVLTYNVSNLSKAGQWFAKKALAAWSATTGIEFKHVKASKADIKFVQNDNSGAYATTQFNAQGDITKAKVNIPTSWYQGDEYKLDSYGYQTFLHEIGHALGLGHAGNYNGSGTFSGDARFSNDSWQMSIMSYFSQTENPNVKGSFAYTLTPMPADIAAVHKLYGEPSGAKKANAGKTTWGFDSNAKGPARQFTETKKVMTMTIYDQGGEDVMDFSKTGKNQKIDLNPGAFSNVLGKAYNVQIEGETWIENAKTGSGKDKLYGNARANDLYGGANADKLWGRAGADALHGQLGDDNIRGGDGADRLFGGKGTDALYGDDGDDVLNGNEGGDNLSGNGGDDTLRGGIGNDRLHGDAGTDELYGQLGDDKIHGGDGEDSLFGGKGADALYGNDGDDVLNGNEGSDNLSGNGGGDILRGGTGNDRLHGDAGTDELHGQNGNDKIHGGDGADRLFGGKGADVLFGNDGNDVLKGGFGADKLAGNAGYDTLDGGNGNDIMTGGADADIFVFNAGHDTITDFDNTEGDTIEIEGSLVATTDVAQFLTENAIVKNGNVVIELDNGATLTVQGVSNTLDLVDDISFI